MFSAVNLFQAEKTLKGNTQQKKLNVKKVKKKSLICKQSEDVPVSKQRAGVKIQVALVDLY